MNSIASGDVHIEATVALRPTIGDDDVLQTGSVHCPAEPRQRVDQPGLRVDQRRVVVLPAGLVLLRPAMVVDGDDLTAAGLGGRAQPGGATCRSTCRSRAITPCGAIAQAASQSACASFGGRNPLALSAIFLVFASIRFGAAAAGSSTARPYGPQRDGQRLTLAIAMPAEPGDVTSLQPLRQLCWRARAGGTGRPAGRSSPRPWLPRRTSRRPASGSRASHQQPARRRAGRGAARSARPSAPSRISPRLNTVGGPQSTASSSDKTSGSAPSRSRNQYRTTGSPLGVGNGAVAGSSSISTCSNISTVKSRRAARSRTPPAAACPGAGRPTQSTADLVQLAAGDERVDVRLVALPQRRPRRRHPSARAHHLGPDLGRARVGRPQVVRRRPRAGARCRRRRRRPGRGSPACSRRWACRRSPSPGAGRRRTSPARPGAGSRSRRRSRSLRRSPS